MSYLLVGDLHLTDRPRDAYRFGIFKWIKQQQIKHKPKATFVMGDLCDQKDRHSAALVNRIVDELEELSEIYILMGNHDYIDPKTPFFKFLNKLENVHFITKPSVFGDIGAIPHCRTQEQFDEACKQVDRKDGHFLLLHNTFTGASSETGKKLSGLDSTAAQMTYYPDIYAGDVHMPQRHKGITYVGAPYHIRFGDNFEPNCLLIDFDKHDSKLHFEAPRKWSLTITEADELNNYDVLKGDQVRITLELAAEEVVEWKNYKQKVREFCLSLGLEVFGINLKINTIKKKTKAVKTLATAADIITSFCTSEGVGNQIRDVGLGIAKE